MLMPKKKNTKISVTQVRQHIYTICTVPCGSSSCSLPRTSSQLFFDKVYGDKIMFDLWKMCALCWRECEKGIEACYRGELGIQQSVTLKRGRMCSSNLQGTDLSWEKSGHLSPGRQTETPRGAVVARQVRMPLRGRRSEKTVLIKE